ncbi:hypothetical protein SM033_00052 [Vibrio phage vB_VpaM_sm033]|nr:hypothetical protein SM033_00052 [Vibrio phage vB_VpaM_sm033]
MSISAQTLNLLAKDSEGTRFFKVIGKKDGKITISVDPQNELGVEEVTIKMPEGLKAKVNDKVAITLDGDKQKFEVTSKEAIGKTSRSSTPRHSMDSNAGM